MVTSGKNGTAPFLHSRKVAYGDCDPSGILYTPRAFDFAVEAAFHWYREILGINFATLVNESNLDVPFVHASCNYLRPVRPGDQVHVAVEIERLGRSSINFGVVGRTVDAGEACWQVKLVSCVVDRSDFRSIDIPLPWRQRIERYQDDCRQAGAGSSPEPPFSMGKM